MSQLSDEVTDDVMRMGWYPDAPGMVADGVRVSAVEGSHS